MILPLTTTNWSHPFSPLEQQNAMEALEQGKVIYLPQLSFVLENDEVEYLTPRILASGTKNISFNPSNKILKGMIFGGEAAGQLAALMLRFSKLSHLLINQLFPRYQSALLQGRTSFRPVEIDGRPSSVLKDDTRLHIDAFPATPNQGKRILRVFSNVNNEGKSRHWHLGEPFEQVVNHFRSQFQKPIWGSRALLAGLNITKSYRSLYDHAMLSLHNQMKLSEDYQRQVSKTSMHFPPGSTWIVMTDQVSHAALSGQHVLEQTFYLPIAAMQQPEQSPLKILEKVLGKTLV